MSLRIGRTGSLLAAVGAATALFVATVPAAAPAFVGVQRQTFNNWVVSGSLTPKKLNEPIDLPKGSTFNGTAVLEYENVFENLRGTLGGTVSVPPFNASLRLLGLVPTTVGVTFEQVGPADGSITGVPSSDCPRATRLNPCANLNVPTKVNVGLTMVGTLGVSVPTHCETSEPISFQLNGDETLVELAVFGPQFSGTTTIPSITCAGPEALTLAPALTLVMSGPDNPYSITISNPENLGLPRP
jgi:hypothetical protein